MLEWGKMKASSAPDRHTFVLRIWRESGPVDTAPIWRGHIQHVRSGRESYVLTVNEIVAFLKDYAGELPGADNQRCDA